MNESLSFSLKSPERSLLQRDIGNSRKDAQRQGPAGRILYRPFNSQVFGQQILQGNNPQRNLPATATIDDEWPEILLR